MQQRGAQPEDEAPGGEPGEADGEADGGEGEGAAPASYSYPDPTEVDASSPTIQVRNRLTRTPSRKTRDTAPLQPTAPRPRATVEPLRRPPAGSTGGADSPMRATKGTPGKPPAGGGGGGGAD